LAKERVLVGTMTREKPLQNKERGWHGAWREVKRSARASGDAGQGGVLKRGYWKKDLHTWRAERVRSFLGRGGGSGECRN